MIRFLLLLVVVSALGMALRAGLRALVQARLRRLGRELERRGYRFEDWLRAAGLRQADLRDRRRREEVARRLCDAAEQLRRS